MLAMIPTDFEVAPVYQDAEVSLYWARRPDVWHFVLVTTSSLAPNHQSLHIDQFHWPRYRVARALAAADGAVPAVQPHGFSLGLDRGLVVLSLKGRKYQLPDALVADMRRDLPVLVRAIDEVAEADGGYEVRGAVTFGGNPVVAEQRRLAEAIAFEREARGDLDPHDFAVYSAFCTWRDFIRDEPEKRHSIPAGMASEMIGWDPRTFGSKSYWESVLMIQEQLWGRRIWGPGIDAEEGVLRDALERAVEPLASIQFAQFVLMNGMHGGGAFHALATLLGLMDFDSYKYWRTLGLEPDSPAEQEIRTHSSFIELLGISDAD